MLHLLCWVRVLVVFAYPGPVTAQLSVGFFPWQFCLEQLSHCMFSGFFSWRCGHVMTLWQPVFCYIIDEYFPVCYHPGP